jgi:UDP-glucuronate decarboxylase
MRNLLLGLLKVIYLHLIESTKFFIINHLMKKYNFKDEDFLLVAKLSVEGIKNIKKLKKKNILITGVSGFIGSNLARSIIYLNKKKSLGIKLYGISKSLNDSHNQLSGLKNKKNVILKKKDLVTDSLEDLPLFDFIIHAASTASPAKYHINLINTIVPNTLGTYKLLNEKIKKKTSKFIYISSASVYGERKKMNVPTKENDLGYLDFTLPENIYPQSKRMGENICFAIGKKKKINFDIIRLYHTYGPGLTLDDGRVFSDFMENIINKKKIIIKSDGSVKRNFCYISDAINAILRILLAKQTNQVYNVGNDVQEFSIKQFAKKILKIFPEKKIKLTYKRRLKSQNYYKSKLNRSLPCVDKIKKIGWSPKVKIEDGMKMSFKSYKLIS